MVNGMRWVNLIAATEDGGRLVGGSWRFNRIGHSVPPMTRTSKKTPRGRVNDIQSRILQNRPNRSQIPPFHH